MPVEFPAVDGWPAKYNLGSSKPEYEAILDSLMVQPPEAIRVVAAGLTKAEAANLRTWLGKREGIAACTTGRKDQLERYGFDTSKLPAPKNYIVLAQYTEPTETEANT